MEDRIGKTVELEALVARVWRALTDHKEFGEWFRVALEGPFVVGEVSRGQITYPGYEHMKWVAQIKTMETKRLFAYSWCPFDVELGTDSTQELQTLVEFRLEPTANGTRLVISESGFNALPDDERRVGAMRRNSEGWSGQVKNIAAFVE